jgi:ribosome-binding protein aMBF1 (putative translation factor)
MLSGAQIREARSRLGWSSQELAKRAHVLESTVKRAERTAGEPLITLEHQRKIRATFSAAGIAFEGVTAAATA